jgi:hypothetical protein
MESGGMERMNSEFLDAAERNGQGGVCAEVLDSIERQLSSQAYERGKGNQSKLTQVRGRAFWHPTQGGSMPTRNDGVEDSGTDDFGQDLQDSQD